MKRFDRKFGETFLGELPRSPGVYLFRDVEGEVIYVGKAKDLRRRLSDYRNATRRKAHRKMRAIVRDAESVETRDVATEADALLLENELIREFRPQYNVDGAFDFLYPAIGSGLHEGRLLLCFSSEPEAYSALDLEWHGVFRPRWRARAAFDGFIDLFGQIGHAEPRSRLPEVPYRKGTQIVAFRRVPEAFLAAIRTFLAGESDALLEMLFLELLEESQARRAAKEVEAQLRFLREFYRDDARALRDARTRAQRKEVFVPGGERDGLFIRVRHDSV